MCARDWSGRRSVRHSRTLVHPGARRWSARAPRQRHVRDANGSEERRAADATAMLRYTLRRGVTLVELVVTMAVGGLALSLIAAVCLRQQRVISDLSHAAALTAQLRDAAAILPIDLRALSSGLGDIRDARDTSLEVRATIASAVVCDTARAG